VIRTVALGAVCLAGLSDCHRSKEITAAATGKVIFPVVTGNRADRLQLMIRRDTPTDAERVDVVYVPPVEDLAPSNLSAPQKAASPPPPRLVSRHWHDPHDLKSLEATKQKASRSTPPKTISTDRAPKKVSDAKECRSDGLDPLLRKLKLSPPCE
jgi:hypothetical protein